MFEKTVLSPHGLGVINAVFETKSADYNENTSSNYNYKIAEGTSDDNKYIDSNTYSSISYSMYYWSSVASRDAYMADSSSHNVPMIWVQGDPLATTFYGSDLDPSYSGLSDALKAEKHFSENILEEAV